MMAAVGQIRRGLGDIALTSIFAVGGAWGCGRSPDQVNDRGAVLGVAAVAAIASYEHAHVLVPELARRGAGGHDGAGNADFAGTLAA